ncbi:unnamed protein product [Linum trigynum]|uniref:Uncharacterized protein n=1 Tax=Linum trigynum TaxID=586398 RepID=A0AAV2DY50_9ROSI
MSPPPMFPFDEGAYVHSIRQLMTATMAGSSSHDQNQLFGAVDDAVVQQQRRGRTPMFLWILPLPAEH